MKAGSQVHFGFPCVQSGFLTPPQHRLSNALFGLERSGALPGAIEAFRLLLVETRMRALW